MGRAARARPKYLAEKLRQLREGLGLSQNKLIPQLGLKGEITQQDISSYELGENEPTLIFLLRIARLAGGLRGTGRYLEMLIDDNLKLRLPERRNISQVKKRPKK
jgi:transcriptional regulator with XRE-family HTH domain